MTGGNNEGKNYLRLSPKNKKFKETDAFETAGVQSYTISLEKMKKIVKRAFVKDGGFYGQCRRNLIINVGYFS